jgi:hypothetical protein
MPRVPTYDQNRVSLRAVPDVRTAPAPQPLEGADKALSQVGAAMDSIYQDEKRKATIASVYEARAAVDALADDIESNPETGVIAQRGKNAVNMESRYMPGWDEKIGAIRGKYATNPDVLLALDGYTADRGNHLRRSMARHEYGETQKLYVTGIEAAITTARDKAVSATDPNESERHIQLVRNAVTDLGAVEGWTPEIVAQKQKEQESGARRGVAENLINKGQYEAAKAYMGKYGETLTEEDEAAVVQYGKVAAQRELAERRSAISFARQEEAYRKNQQFEATSKLYFDKGAGAITTEMLSNLDDSGRQAMLRMMNGEQKDTSRSDYLYSSLMDMSVRDPVKFKSLDLIPYYEGMSESDITRLKARMDDVRKDQNAPLKPKETEHMTRSTQASRVLRATLFPDAKELTGQAKTEFESATVEFANRIESLNADGKMTSQQFDDELSRFAAEKWARKYAKADDGWFADKPDANLPLPDTAYIDTSDVPETIEANSVKILNDMASEEGVTLTDDMLNEAYAIWATRGDEGVKLYLKALRGSK